MQAIGWTCALIAIAFTKNALLTAAENQTRLLSIENQNGPTAVAVLPTSVQSAKDSGVREVEEILDDLFNGGDEVQGTSQARTFGHKRLQFMLMPMMYKMGVMMTMLTVLTVISLKGLLIGAILLILKLSTVIAKFSSGWQHHSSPSWPGQPIHVHVHNSLPTGHGQAYSGWMPPSGPGDDEHYYYKG